MKRSRDDLYAQFEALDVFAPAPGRTLIAGSNLYDTGKEDRRKKFKHAVGVDQIMGPGVDVVADLESNEYKRLGMFNHVECLSVLEHSKKPWVLAKNLESMLPIGGTLYLSVPFVWRVHNYPGDYWRFTLEGVRELFTRIQWRKISYAHTSLDEKGILPKFTDDAGHPYLGRTEVIGFGAKL